MTIAEPRFSFAAAIHAAPAVAALAAAFLLIAPCRAQAPGPGPLTPPPDHNVRRLSTEATPEPPDLPPEEIIKRFSQKEDQYLEARTHFWFRKTIRIVEFGPDDKPAGEYELVTEPGATAEGKLYDKIVKQSQAKLRFLRFEPEDIEALARVPAYPLTSGQLAKYDLKYVGKEQVDEIECYLFQVKPKTVERQRAYFDGIIWVDDKFLDVVKTYGKWVTDLGDVHSPTLPFTIFETYRENVDGKYWLPNYARSDDFVHLKDQNVPIRLIIKWTDFKQISPPKPPAPPAAPAPAAKP